MKFSVYLKESQLEKVEKESGKVLKTLPADFEYVVDINGISIRKGKSILSRIDYKIFKDEDKIAVMLKQAFDRAKMKPKNPEVISLGNINWEKDFDF
jgi:hypothetical protein